MIEERAGYQCIRWHSLVRQALGKDAQQKCREFLFLQRRIGKVSFAAALCCTIFCTFVLRHIDRHHLAAPRGRSGRNVRLLDVEHVLHVNLKCN
jgi:hypothetical protein